MSLEQSLVTHKLFMDLVGCFVKDGFEMLAETTPVGIEVDHQNGLAGCGCVEGGRG